MTWGEFIEEIKNTGHQHTLLISHEFEIMLQDKTAYQSNIYFALIGQAIYKYYTSPKVGENHFVKMTDEQINALFRDGFKGWFTQEEVDKIRKPYYAAKFTDKFNKLIEK